MVDDAAPDLNMPSVSEIHALWVDEAQLVVRRVSMPDGLSEHVVGGIVTEWPDVGVTAAEAAHYAKAVAWDNDGRIFRDYVFEERRTELSWGASSSGITWIIDIAEGLSSEALTLAAYYAIQKIRGRHAHSFDPGPLTVDRARDKVRQSIGLVYEIDAASLRVVGDSRSADRREIKVEFVGDDGQSYWGRVSLLGGLYLTAEVGRSGQ